MTTTAPGPQQTAPETGPQQTAPETGPDTTPETAPLRVVLFGHGSIGSALAGLARPTGRFA
ncbi:hypothetical protein V6N00_00720 [Tersicoccus sp. MR15.9]|uniref:hypothetical protein n=1 Tax=Tersicoccus mangrovi TaxID=3121635 RepID=UPI002FE695BA